MTIQTTPDWLRILAERWRRLNDPRGKSDHERNVMEPTQEEAARAVAGCAAVAEHDARVAERRGLHGEQLFTVQMYARKLRHAANLLNPDQAKSLAPLTPVSRSNMNDTGRFAKPSLI